MNATKFLISTAAAVTVASAIGMAYAQTGTNNSAGTPGMSGSAQAQTTTTTTTGQTPADVRSTQDQRQNAAPGSLSTDSSGTSTGANRAGVVAPASPGNANSGTTYNPTPGTAGGMQGQRQSGAPGGLTTDSSGSANSSGNANTSGTGNTNSRTGSNANDGNAAMTSDGSANARRTTRSTNGGMATERGARADRN